MPRHRQVSVFRELRPDRPLQHDELDHCDGAGCVLCSGTRQPHVAVLRMTLSGTGRCTSSLNSRTCTRCRVKQWKVCSSSSQLARGLYGLPARAARCPALPSSAQLSAPPQRRFRMVGSARPATAPSSRRDSWVDIDRNFLGYLHVAEVVSALSDAARC